MPGLGVLVSTFWPLGETYSTSLYVGADGRARSWQPARSGAPLDPDTLGKVCRGSPDVLFLGSGEAGAVEIAPEAEAILHYRQIELRALARREAIDAYNAHKGRKAIFLALEG